MFTIFFPKRLPPIHYRGGLDTYCHTSVYFRLQGTERATMTGRYSHSLFHTLIPIQPSPKVSRSKEASLWML